MLLHCKASVGGDKGTMDTSVCPPSLHGARHQWSHCKGHQRGNLSSLPLDESILVTLCVRIVQCCLTYCPSLLVATPPAWRLV